MSNSQSSGSFVATKSTTNPSISAPPTQTPATASSGNDPQRRSGGGGSTFGSNLSSKNNWASPRSGQAGRPNHRNRRKPSATASEEIAAESQVTMGSRNRRKGTSITHLMSWNVSTPVTRSSDSYRWHNNRRYPTYGMGSGYHEVDKARYVNANYRFIVHPGGDFRAQAINPDDPLPWHLVLQVLASAKTQQPTCPICLSAPVAPRMSKCGHIFCLPCLIRYMASVEDPECPPERRPKYKKCVICMDSVYLAESRPVRFFTGQENTAPREGEDVVLRLVMKRMGSILALPKDGAHCPTRVEEIPWHFATEVMDYARIMKGTEAYMVDQYTREMEDLKIMQQEDEAMFGEDGEWARKAVASIGLQIEAVKGMGNPKGYPSDTFDDPEVESERKKEKRPEIKFNENGEDVPLMYHVSHEARSGHSSSSISRSQTPSDNKPEAAVSVSAPEPAPELAPAAKLQPQDTGLSASQAKARDTIRRRNGISARGDTPYYFYQALPHYYLSTLDIKILRAAFGSYSDLPSTILPRVENVTTGYSVDDDFRKRARYLAHLPYGCEIAFLECDWTDIVRAEVLETFRAEIDQRRKRKLEKESREERARIKAESRHEENHWGLAKQRKESSAGDYEEGLLATMAAQRIDGAELDDAEPSSTPAAGTPSLGYDSLDGEESLIAGLASPSTSPAQGWTVWGTPLIHLPGESEPAVSMPISDDNGGWLPDRERDLMLQEQVLVDLESPGSIASGSGRAPSQGKGAQGGKKKKFKKVTLMTNGGKRGA
ncbi:hypothetical protein L873DRAFT_1681819 [Choiromyces venosus 120613-1]|uniref:RING-type domain-containing protein n=1 Tax=Choiromyces venosus 120613-1 TaxID=1336337 RepID=A0A3N4JP27_9PEZI|nr:hypothetical protein L873DRAFT_1681819 [Choiromyces venosus 120613-1]